jgi:hypothetical protein
MNLIRHICRIAGVFAGALLASALAAPAAFALEVPPEPAGWDKHPPLPPGHVTGPAPPAWIPVLTTADAVFALPDQRPGVS